MKNSETLKNKLHIRNKHNRPYDFVHLTAVVPELSHHLIKNPSGEDTIDFSDPAAVILLNKALLIGTYGITFWELPQGNLCPPVPGRADYIHYIADLLAEGNQYRVPTGTEVKILDIGVGANSIYPIIGISEYGWQFVASDVSKASFENAAAIVQGNKILKDRVSLRLQKDVRSFLRNIVKPDERFDAVICNPPFFKSEEEAVKQTSRKLKNLGKKHRQPVRNFGGQQTELWYDGGELRFISLYIKESVFFAKQAGWFTTLVSNGENLRSLRRLLVKTGAKEQRIIDMAQGNKASRILAWRF